MSPTDLKSLTVASVWAQDADLAAAVEAHEAKRRNARGLALLGLAFSTLGIVYGDIGTSPLYTFATVFPNGGPDDVNILLGTMSTIFWSFTSVVLVKYVIITIKADDHGEGGLMALYAVICRATGVRSAAQSHSTDAGLAQMAGNHSDTEQKGLAPKIRAAFLKHKSLQAVLLLVVLVGSNMVMADGILTPAISVVSAVEGIQFQVSMSNGVVVAISIVILFLLFAAQSLGTQKVSFAFSPIMLLWFLANAAIGLYNIIHYGASIFRALSPSYMYYYWSGRSGEAWRELGAVMLSITGAEALYADLGHFSRPAIRIGFGAVVYPSLILTYLGQAAMIANNPSTAASAYWSALPHPVYWPMVVLATLAAIIASQAMISGAFSICQQAMALNCFPRLTVKHTSKELTGQIYIPEVNWGLMAGCLVAVGIFQTSTRLGYAYGLTVVSVMLVDTSLIALLALVGWSWHVLFVGIFWLFFTFVLGAYWSSNLAKVPSGAWFSLAVSLFLTIVTYTWYWGQAGKTRYIQENKIKLRDLFEEAPEDEDYGKGGTPSKSAAAWAAIFRHSVASVQSSHSGGSGPPRLHHGLQRLQLAGTKLPVARVPGIGIYFNELLTGVPPVLVRFLGQVPAVHEVVIFLTNRIVPVPSVHATERLLIRKLRFQGFFHVVARYGYLDVADQGPEFINLVMQELFDYLDPSLLQDWAAATHDVEGGQGASRDTEQRGELQLVHLPLGPAGWENGVASDTVMTNASNASSGRRAITLAFPAGEDASRGGLPGEPAPAPWLQQPSVLRRLRSGTPDKALGGADRADATMSLPLPSRGRGRSVLSAVLGGGQLVEDTTASLPLPPDPTRPALPRLMTAAGAAQEPTLSLPLPARLSRPPIYRLPGSEQAGAEGKEKGGVATKPAAISSGATAAASITLKGSTAQSIRDQLRQSMMEGGEGDSLDDDQSTRSGPSNRRNAAGAGAAQDESAAQRELLSGALTNGVTYMIGHSKLRPAPKSNKFKAFWLSTVYSFLVNNVKSTYATYRVPLDMMLEVGVTYEI